MPTPPYASAVCAGPNSDGTASQTQLDRCSLISAGDGAFIAGESVIVSLATPSGIALSECDGASVGTTQISVGVVADGCRYTVASGVVAPGQPLGVMTLAISGAIPSGSALGLRATFCTAPGPDGEALCRALASAMTISGPGASVVDEVPPTLADVPSSLTADATSPDGARVVYTLPTASDNAPEAVSVQCEPPTGSTFPIGVTTVLCVATDGSGNTATASFTITVENTFAGLCRVTRVFETRDGVAHSLCVKLEGAEDALARDDTNATSGKLGAYVDEVEAQAGVSIKTDEAIALEGLARLLLP